MSESRLADFTGEKGQISWPPFVPSISLTDPPPSFGSTSISRRVLAGSETMTQEIWDIALFFIRYFFFQIFDLAINRIVQMADGS